MSNYIVAQLGARMHYAVPRILHNAGMLERLYTDACAVKGLPQFLHLIPKAFRPAGIRRLLGRIPNGVPTNKIQAYNYFGLECVRRMQASNTPIQKTATFLWIGENFCRRIIRDGFGNADSIFTYNSAGLELLLEAKRRGLCTVMEQTIAPQSIEKRLLENEFSRFAELHELIEPAESWRRFADREAAEWETADLILCGSQFVVDGIREAGGPVEKALVVPYGIDLPNFTPPEYTSRQDASLNVLFVGEVGIRKGAHYLIEAARLLASSNPQIKFRLVGTIALPARVRALLPTNVQLTGPIPRSEIRDQFAWADAFCLPSLCEGSATVTYEALAMGLPVICTPNTGSVVTDGVDGLIVPIRDAKAISSRVEELAFNHDLREKLSRSARATSTNYTVEAYGIRLLKYLAEVRRSR